METLKLQPYPLSETPPKLFNVTNSLNSIESTLNNIFPQPSEENKIIGIKRQLGESAQVLSDEQIEYLITDFQYLIDTWLNEFETHVFGGKTLKELLGEK